MIMYYWIFQTKYATEWSNKNEHDVFILIIYTEDF